MEQLFHNTSRLRGMGQLRLLILCVATSCVSPASTLCGDGRVCPDGTVCATVADQPRCVSPDQLAHCNGIASGESCGDNQRCYDGVCLDAGCGNGLADPG